MYKGLILPSLLAIVAWLGGAYLIVEHMVTPHNHTQVEQAGEQKVRKFADPLQAYLTNRSTKLRALASAKTPVTALITSGDLPDQTSVQVFSPEQILVGSGQSPSLNFALVDLLKRGQQVAELPVEILRTGNENNWQLHSIVSRQSEQLLVTQPFAVLENTLAKLDTASGQIQLLQKFPDAHSQTLWRGGDGNGHQASVALKGSYLSLNFSPSSTFVKEHSLPTVWFYAGAGIGIGITLLLLIKFLPRDSRAPWERNKEETGNELNKAHSETTDESSEKVPSRDFLPQGLASAPSATSSTDNSEKKAVTKRSEGKAVNKTELSLSTEFSQAVFRAYDIRGIAGREINEPFAYQLGRALGTLAQHAGEHLLLVGRDGRNSSEQLSQCLIEGILDSGCHSINLGLVPSPLLYYACAKGKNTSSGVIVTASHNPAEYNGFKIVLKGRAMAEEKLQGLYRLMQKGPFKKGEGSNREQEITSKYIDEVFNNIALAGQPHLVVDAGNGATSTLAPRLFEQLGCAVTPIFCEVDGNFPNHAPDPSRPENLEALTDKVLETGADLGVALDGDGDRVTLISSSGRIAWADQLVMLLARDILARNPGENIVFDVKSSRSLSELIGQYGGRPVMWKTGHSPMKAKMLETNAILGGELSGHIFIKDRWFGFDDGIYAAARILEIMALREQSLDELLDTLPKMHSTPEILLPVEETEKFSLIEQLRSKGSFGNADINTIDGLRIEFPDGWGLIRASNTTSALTLRFEAENEQALERIRAEVMGQLKLIAPKIAVPDWQLLD
ncbi:phosphomannomutase/phosphoglucomutase [Microbulbifer sp. OS29]|uniref:phosphomannomutase n=1 Tax=Microbulbifer okhotskensis TaxID=2926617 RepID=A0A9X2ENU8_9GAMM|nr:phosphomannomutase/phosphoglucomutase [Microbulbifer okhotskensis]MCO1332856.1 phosphomannomutase/phosphoglucomutase [Microbulbifer okhotskensis]